MTSAPHVLIEPRLHDLGDGFVVRRMLPSARQRSVGPFVFFDHVGPVELAPGRGVDVRPHPHIGLSTMTYLFDGVFTHRDSLGVVQDIRPGAVNWMTAGRGVVHSERTPEPERANGHRLHGVQFWVGLPNQDAQIAPSFAHHAVEELPQWSAADGQVHFRLVAGEAYGKRSPVPVHSRLFCLDVRLEAGSSLEVPTEHAERAIQVVEGEVEIDGIPLPMHTMLALEQGATARINAGAEARLIIFGGDPFAEPRFIWWNFVSVSRELIDQAREDWKNGRFDQVPGETEFIPLPDH
jgi:redox-sensitive bicupin YhaK (pirin superfamily)